MLKSNYTILLVILLFLNSACVKDEVIKKDDLPGVVNTKSKIEVNFKAMMNGKELGPKSKWYTNSSNEVFTVTKFNYYISNIKLTDSNGKVFAEPESYHLIRHTDSINKFYIKDVPFGTYTKIEYLIGVDSTRNVSGAQTGALDPANIMFWEWNSGYIFLKLEGSYASATTNEMEYSIHVGGFTGKYSCLQTYSTNLNNNLIVQENKIPKLYVNTVLDEFFKNPTKISFDQYYIAIGDSMFNLISKNYKDMFVFDKIEN